MFSNKLTCTTFRFQKSISGMFLTFICTVLLHVSCASVFAQDAPYPMHLSAGSMHTVQLHPVGQPNAHPFIPLGGGRLTLSFDDFSPEFGEHSDRNKSNGTVPPEPLIFQPWPGPRPRLSSAIVAVP